MKSFKDFVKKKKEISWLDIPSFAETRHLPTDSKHNVNESLDQFTYVRWQPWTKQSENGIQTFTNAHGRKVDKIHDHPQVVPDDSEDPNPDIQHYTSTESKHPEHGHRSSSNINNHLRYLAGEKVSEGGENTQGIVGGHSPEKVRGAIEDLSSQFRRSATNKIPVTTYTGVPEHIGNKIRRSKPGTDHYFPGFTSSTSVQYNAHEFANRYNKGKTPHVIQFHALPGSVRSFAHHSRFGEHEFGIHHGARATYSHSTKESDGTLVHHMILHPDHLELDDYRRNQ